jgi:uncharacterized phage protein gp47/JayE
MSDLTRWNRAGLSRFEYLDGNGAVFLERLRAGLEARFPQWRPVPGMNPLADEGEEAKKARLEALYQADPGDMLWQLLRQFARSCHVLGAHIDACANESYLETASQWENLRRLVALLDYAPLPPASASAPLALLVKTKTSGTVTAGLQIKHNPVAGKPVVFETLAELAVDAAFNTLRAQGWGCNPAPLSGTRLVLEGRLDKVQIGEPLVLEHENGHWLSAHLTQGIVLGADRTTLTLSPVIPAGFTKGTTLVHCCPKEKLKPLGPATTGVETAGYSLQLAVAPQGLAAGDIVVIRSNDDKPLYRRIKTVHHDRLVFHRPVGRLTLAGATVARPVTLPLSELANPPQGRVTLAQDTADGQGQGTVIDMVFAAGDWSRLAGQWLADVRVVGKGTDRREYLPCYRCLHAKYVPVDMESGRLEEGDRPGYTCLTLTWRPDVDGVPDDNDFRLVNPQTLLAPPMTAGPWPVDVFLNKSEEGRLVRDMVVEACKRTTAGDLAVAAKGAQMAWTRLGGVAPDQEREQTTLSAESGWQDRGGGPYFLGRTRVHAHFAVQARVWGWTENNTPLSGRRVYLDQPLAGMKAGRALLVDNGAAVMESTLAEIGEGGAWLRLNDDLPAGTTVGNLSIWGNVAAAGNGEVRPWRVLGSGDSARSNQCFTLEAAELSFVADATMASGVRAALEVAVGGETWTQVANLKDSASSDAHYQVRIDEDGNAVIRFGDGRHGRRLPSGGNNIRVRLRQGVGRAGNLPAGSLVKLTQPHPLVDAVLQPIESSGGNDRESRADLRKNAPASLLALDRAVSLEDCAQLARSHPSVWQATAFRLPPGLGRRERLEVVVMAAGGGKLSDPLKRALQAWLAARTQPGVSLIVSDHVRVGFRLSVTVRAAGAFDGQTVKNEVNAALQAAFGEHNRRLGQPLYRGEVYKVVDAVAGVENSSCAIELVWPQPGLAAGDKPSVAVVGEAIVALKPGPRHCLLFDDQTFAAKLETPEEGLE